MQFIHQSSGQTQPLGFGQLGMDNMNGICITSSSKIGLKPLHQVQVLTLEPMTSEYRYSKRDYPQQYSAALWRVLSDLSIPHEVK